MKVAFISFATGITRSTSIVSKLGDKAFDIMCVVKGEKETSVYLDVPSVLRSHWTKYVLHQSVFLDICIP